MKKYIFTLATITLMLGACEDPVEVATDPAENLVTVDAWLHNIASEDQTIKISYSQPYFDSTFVAGINNADVRVSSSTGKTYTFENADDNGNYLLKEQIFEWLGEPAGTQFDLEIQVDGSTITASTEKNPVPVIDSIWQEFREEPLIDDGIYCTFFATDLPGLGDTYWIKTYKNGKFLNSPGEINIAFDSAFSAGAEVDNLVFIQPIQELNNEIDENFAPIPWELGETIKVELHSISNEAFFYMEVLRDQLLNSSNSIFAEPLANTSSNMTSSDGKEVLGFFNVASTSVMEEIIGE